MFWRYASRSLFVFLALAVIVIGTIVIYLSMPAWTPPFRDAQDRRLPNSIASIERWRLNGVEQSVILRGRNVANPLIVWIHGGPGISETPLLRHYNAALEDRFVVVYWDQRYAGQSLDPFGPKPTHEDVSEYVSDLDALILRLRARFHRDKVVLIAHPWGTFPGILYAEAHPGHLFAYVGIEQVADSPESERRSRAFVLAQARMHHDADDVARLVKPPGNDSLIYTPRDLLEKYGGSFHANVGIGTLALITARASEANWRNFAAVALNADFNMPAIRESSNAVLDERHTRFSVPVFFVSGRYDHQVEASLSYRYFLRISAPEKRFVWFEKSGHAPPFEESERFNAWVTHVVLPLAHR